MRVIEDRIIVQGDAFRMAVGRKGEVSCTGTHPPALEHLMMVAPAEHVVEPQAEARARESVEPDLCVLAVDAVRAARPLAREVLNDARVGPGELPIAVTDHGKWLVPIVIA